MAVENTAKYKVYVTISNEDVIEYSNVVEIQVADGSLVIDHRLYDKWGQDIKTVFANGRWLSYSRSKEVE